MFKQACVITAVTLSALAAPVAASAAIFGTNLIVNGDAEAGAGSASGNDLVAVPGWDLLGDFTVVRYGAPNFPGGSDPGVSVGGTNFFAGGPSNGSSAAQQTIDLSSAGLQIDTGTTAFDLSGYLGGFSSQGDNARITLTFFDSGLSPTGLQTVLGPVSNTDRGNLTGLLFRETTGFIPVGARSVEVQLSAVRQAGSYNDGYADNLSLVLNAGRVTPPGVPEPATWAMMLLGFGGLGATLRRRRAQAVAA
jgi:hypothetical protein